MLVSLSIGHLCANQFAFLISFLEPLSQLTSNVVWNFGHKPGSDC